MSATAVELWVSPQNNPRSGQGRVSAAPGTLATHPRAPCRHSQAGILNLKRATGALVSILVKSAVVCLSRAPSPVVIPWDIFLIGRLRAGKLSFRDAGG
jgi:hypothetical protein